MTMGKVTSIVADCILWSNHLCDSNVGYDAYCRSGSHSCYSFYGQLRAYHATVDDDQPIVAYGMEGRRNARETPKRMNLLQIVSERLKSYILENELKAGDKFPSEKQLIDSLGVS
ncbi:GntR family transcriptional regulator [Paenibacillus hemerocallicola]|uniref:GntR family transcriptional regulator n=1 Tax=Paenibacillus hemerocallicola TaxID=1172614 RepID=A0A5C4T8Q5_9BACL|nr:GntR family transcriptional regulator [Paenibacillus hemerocallicola]